MSTPTGHTTAIRASEVIGTSVRAKSGENIGTVQDVVLDKTSSRIMFAVVSIGGVTTTSGSYHPVPWSVLDYDPEKSAYVLAFSKDEVARGPAVSMLSELTKHDGADHRQAADRHYKVAPDR